MTHAARALQSHDLSGEGINSGSRNTFLTTQGHGVSPRMRDQLNVGPPPRQREHERRYTPVTLPFIITRQIWKDDYYGQLIFGDLVGLKFHEICLTDEEKPRKNLTKETCPNWESNPGPLRDMRAC